MKLIEQGHGRVSLEIAGKYWTVNAEELLELLTSGEIEIVDTEDGFVEIVDNSIEYVVTDGDSYYENYDEELVETIRNMVLDNYEEVQYNMKNLPDIKTLTMFHHSNRTSYVTTDKSTDKTYMIYADTVKDAILELAEQIIEDYTGKKIDWFSDWREHRSMEEIEFAYTIVCEVASANVNRFFLGANNVERPILLESGQSLFGVVDSWNYEKGYVRVDGEFIYNVRTVWL